MLDGVMPTWFDDPRASIVERLVRLGRSIPARRAARVPLLPRPRAAPPGTPLRRPAARRHRQRAVAEPRAARSTGSTCRSQGGRVDVRFFETLGAARRCGRRPGCTSGLLHPADGLVGARGPDRRGAALRPRLRRGHRLRLEPAPPAGRRAADRAAPRASRRRSRPRSRRRPAFGWPAGWARIPDEDWTQRAGRRLRRVLRQRRPPQLVPQPRPDRRGARPPADATATSSSTTRAARASSLDRLKLRMFDTAGRSGHRRQLTEVPARRAWRSSATTRRSASGCCAS